MDRAVHAGDLPDAVGLIFRPANFSSAARVLRGRRRKRLLFFLARSTNNMHDGLRRSFLDTCFEYGNRKVALSCCPVLRRARDFDGFGEAWGEVSRSELTTKASVRPDLNNPAHPVRSASVYRAVESSVITPRCLHAVDVIVSSGW